MLLYIGDDLRDFDDNLRFAKLPEKPTADDLDRAIAKRKDAVDKARGNFGQNWVILPNPAYGEWTKPQGRGQAAFDRLIAAVSRSRLRPLHHRPAGIRKAPTRSAPHHKNAIAASILRSQAPHRFPFHCGNVFLAKAFGAALYQSWHPRRDPKNFEGGKIASGLVGEASRQAGIPIIR